PNFRFQLKQPQRIRNGHTALANATRSLFLGESVLLNEATVGHRLLDRIEVGALDVFDERQFQQLRIRGLADDDGDRFEPSKPGGLEPALARDEAVAAVFIDADHERLDDAVFADGIGKLAQLLRFEVRAWLFGIRRNEVDVELVGAAATCGDGAGARRVQFKRWEGLVHHGLGAGLSWLVRRRLRLRGIRSFRCWRMRLGIVVWLHCGYRPPDRRAGLPKRLFADDFGEDRSGFGGLGMAGFWRGLLIRRRWHGLRAGQRNSCRG